MANRTETTFGELQIDERFKKLERSLKLALLKQERNKIAHDGTASLVTSWPSISSINVNTSDSICATPSMQTSMIKSEVLASSNNLRNIHTNSRKKSRNTNQEVMITSSVKQYPNQQDSRIDQLIMPPPSGRTIYRTFKEPQSRVRTLSNCEQTMSTLLNKSVQSSTIKTMSLKSAPSWISTNTYNNKEYLNTFVQPTTPVNKIDRVFSRWKVMLNDRYELVIKGTLECGKIAHSKPVIRRYTATCVESKYKHKYNLEGNIVDERNALPDYIRGKFYNGFPDDWENVYQIWRTYISQGCPVTFRWPTPITDSDDDLNSELTDLTYARVKNNRAVPAMKSYNSNKYNKTESLNDKSLEKKEKCHNCSTHGSQNYEKNTSFIKPFISNSEKDIVPIVQMKNIKSPYDENIEQNVKSDINPPKSDLPSFTSDSPFIHLPSSKVNKLKNIFQEDILNIIINNLADWNCSPVYVNKITEMVDCLEYVMSYRMGSECNNDLFISPNHKTSKSEAISLQQSLMSGGSHANTNKLENRPTELKSYEQSTDLGYGSIRRDSNAIQLSNSVNIEPEHDKDSDKSESETYAGVPKISIERVLKTRDASRKIHKRKVRKTAYSDVQKNTANLHACNAEGVEFEPVRAANPITNTKKSLLSDESCISITEDEVETTENMGECRRTTDIAQRPQEMTFSSHRETQRNFDVYGGSKSVKHVQNKQPLDASEAQRVNLNAFMKEQKIPYRAQENAHSQFVTDVDYITDSDIDIITVSSNTRKTGGYMAASHANVDQNILINSESNSNFSERPCVPSKLHREFIEQTKSETAMKRSKPTIISLMPVNLNLRISRTDSKTEQSHNPNIIVRNEDKQCANIRPSEEADKKKSIPKMSIVTKSTINDSQSKITVDTKSTINESHSKTTVDSKKEVCPITNNRNESDNVNPTNPTTNPTTKQSKSRKLGVEKDRKVLTAWMPKVVHYAKSKSELGLTFEGKLFNEAGHVVNRKFTTDIVLRRLSATLIETVNHEFYELRGHLNDNKHIIPKELVRKCRYGCPANIEQFCLTWKTLQHDNVQEVKEKSHDTTIESLNAPVSSRGRRILPVLCYWRGERITTKDNNPVYDPGSLQESSLVSLTDKSKEVSKNTTTSDEGKKKKVSSKNPSRRQSVNKQTLLRESNKATNTDKNQMIVAGKTRASKKSPKIKAVNGKRRRLAQKLTYSSTDSNEEEQEASPRKRMRNSRTNANLEAPWQYTMTLRKRQKTEASSNRSSRRNTTRPRRDSAYRSPTKRSDMTYTYYRVAQLKDFLSENEESV